VAEDKNRGRCPDGGYCHHECKNPCWRTEYAGPLSDTYPDNMWPVDVVIAGRHHDGVL